MNIMNIKTSRWRWVLATAGAILIGAIGSGVWQNALGPALHWLGLWTLDIIALTFRSYKADVYIQIAKDVPETAALSFLSILSAIVMGILGYFTGHSYSEVRYLKQKLHELQQPPINPQADSPPGAKPDQTNRDRAVLRLRYAQRYLYCLVGASVFAATLLLVQTSRIAYIRSAQAYYRQGVRIISPIVTEQQRLQFESRFGLIQNQNDYVALIRDIRQSAEGAHLKLPEFSIW